MLDLEAARCACQLDALYYFPGYYTEEEERQLLTTIRSSQTKWVQLSGRRLQNHGGIVHTKGLIPSPLPRWLQGLADRLHTDIPLFGDKAPNHVLINSYNPGEGIMPHQDGPLYLPVVAILSLGAPAVLRWTWKKQPEGGTGGLPPVASLLAAPRSLLVFTGDAYEQCLHGIEEVDTEQVDPSIVNLATAGVPLPHTTTITNSSRAPPTTAVAAAAQAPSCMQPGAAGSSGAEEGTRPQSPLADAPAAGSQAAHQAAADSSEPPGPVPAAGGAVLQPCENLPKDACGGVCDTKPGAAPAAPGEGAAAQQQQQKAPQQQQQQVQGVPRGGERISLTVRHVLKVHRGLLVGKR